MAHGQRSQQKTLRSDDRAVGAFFEDLPAFIIIVIAIGIFIVAGVKAVASYKDGYDTADEYETAYGYALQMRSHPSFLRAFATQAGDFDHDHVAEMQAYVKADPVKGRQKLSIPERIGVRILDVSNTTCPTRDCVVFDFPNGINTAGEVAALRLPATLRFGNAEIHAAIIEVRV